MTVDPGQGQVPAKLSVDQIKVGERGRTELGDVAGLAKSIKDIGLLHPVVVTAERELVAGERRLAAVRQLNWTEVAVTVVDLDNAADVLQAELEENTCRKSLSAYEADVIRQKRERVLAPQAAKNKQANLKQGGEPRDAKLADRKPVGEVRKAAAVGTGYSGSTLDKVRTIRDAAERGVVKQGKQEVAAPEPVREVAQEAAENVKQTGAAIDREFQRVTQAIDAYVEADMDVKRAQLRRRFLAAMSSAGEISMFDAANVVLTLDDDDWDDLMRLRGDLNAWFEQAVSARGHNGPALSEHPFARI